jgi:hypothetical protein
MNPDRTSLEWIEARKRHQLSHAHVQMARELGMNPKKLGKLDNHKQETWKVPLPRFIEELYEKRFGKARPEVVVTMEQRMAASRKKKDERRERKRLERDLEEKNGTPSPSSEKAATASPAIDPRPEVNALLANLKKDKTRKALNVLVQACSGEWTYFDPVYRYYHQSFKVFGLQAKTLELVAALQALAPERKLNARFMKIVTEGTGKTFELEHNQRWDEVTRPIVEAFFHARFFLECAVRSARTLRAPPQLLPSDWAALLYLYELR